jgi:phosphodiesterase/alkaline phosphatase D-like protein
MKLLTIIVLTAALAASVTAAPKQAPKAQAEKITDGPRVEGVGPTWAVIAWTTNTGGSSIIRYGTDANNLSQTAKTGYADNEKTKAQNHRVHLKNLKPNTKYFFQVDSGQGEGTGTEAKSSVSEFTTKGHK